LLIAIIIIAVLSYYSYHSLQREIANPKDIAPESGSFASLKDIDIFYQDEGPADSIPVVLFHGTGSWSEIWRNTIDQLVQNGFRVIALDIPPFGFSGKPLGTEHYTTENQAARINELLDELHISKAIFVGHSVGSRATLEALLMRPERVEKLVLADAALGFDNNPGFLKNCFFGFKTLRNAVSRSSGTNPSVTRTFFEAFVYRDEAISDNHIAMLQKPFAAKNLSVAYADWFEYLENSSPHRSLVSDFENLKTIKVPVLLIWGDKDDVTPLWQAYALIDIIPESTLQIIENTGHIPYIENPEEFNKVLLNFLNDAD
jgi:pimeloyl-ACP methyl ester carboxylesterase